MQANGNELWSLLVIKNHVAKYGIPFCWDSTAAVGQQLVDRKGGVSYVELTELFKKVTWSSPMVLHMLGFLMCFVGMYVLTSLFLSVGDAENLSLLTSDTYGVAWADVQSTVEIILVMKLPAEQTRRLSWRVGLSSALMVAYGYSGEIQDNLIVRWSWWALAMVPFCFVVRPDGAAFVTLMSGMSAYHTEPPLLVGRWGHGCAVLQGCVYVVGGCFLPEGKPPLEDFEETMRSCEAFGPYNGAWVEALELNLPRAGARVVALGDRCLLAFGRCDSDYVEVAVPSFTPSVEPVNVTVRYFDPDTSDDVLVALSIRAFETCSTDKESVTMYWDGSYSVTATMTAESSTDFATALSAVVVADGGDGFCGLTNATSTLPSWIGVNDDLSVVGFFLWLPPATRQIADVLDTWTCPATSNRDSCAVEYAAGYEWLASGVCRVFNNRHFCSLDELTVLRTSREECKLFLPSSCYFA